MRTLWWSLPGPSAFAKLAADDLLDGKNLCLLLPAVMPRGLRAAIQDQLPDPEGWDWRDLNLSYLPDEEAAQPVRLLFDVFCKDVPPGLVRNCTNLVREADFHGKLIWVEGIPEAHWPAWRDFLLEYAEQSRSLPVHERTRFLFVLEGRLAEMAPNPLITLSLRQWSGTVDKLDMMLYCSSLYGRSPLGPLHKSLAVHLLANVAKWDPHTADRLSGLELKELVEPIPALTELAEEYEYGGPEAAWCEGTLNVVEGREYVHSALLAATGETELLTRRIWEAQLATLFPVLEELRMALLDYFDPILTVPFITPHGQIDEKIDLEIGHIYYQIRQFPESEVDPNIRQHVRMLRDLRNDLAHLTPVGRFKLHLVDALAKLPDLLAEGPAVGVGYGKEEEEQEQLQ